MKQSLYEELKWRGFYNQTTLENPAQIDEKKYTFYFGVDPSSDSMTIGNLSTLMMIKHFIAHGHKPILLVGGATGLIGDPDGKSEERQLLSKEQIDKNTQVIKNQFDRIFGSVEYEIVDNYEWFKDINFIEFLRDYGKHVPMRQMLGRDFMQSRLGDDGTGISFAEFSYSLIQGYDYLHLFRTKKATLQVSGSDQWGNSIAGVELIRRVDGGEAHVWTSPLIINKSTGQKFGKTEGGAVWLDPNKTSIFSFYQFWLNVSDEEVESYLGVYTLLNKARIESVMEEFSQDKGSRIAQKTLAEEVTKIVHGSNQANAVKKASNVLFGNANFLELDHDQVDLLKKELTVSKPSGDIYETIEKSGLAESKSEARNFVDSGAISVNGQKITTMDQADFSKGANLLKRGKNSFAIVEV